MLQVMEALCAMALQAGGPGDDATPPPVGEKKIN